jgi:fatty acid desaturase
MSNQLPQNLPAGWYPDSRMPNTQRYWDGQAWTEQVAPLASPSSQTSTYAILAIVLAFVFAPLGIVFGVMGRREVDRSGGQKTGRALATAGMWVGIGYSAFLALYLVGIFVWLAVGIGNSN